MSFQQRYPRFRDGFLEDEKLCSENRALFKEYFDWQERKLKSINDLRELDEACYKTLCHYVSMFKNVVKWFKYRPLKEITKAEIKRVYEDLEDGKILNYHGKPFEDRASYYSKVFKGKLFKMIGKYEHAEEILEFSRPGKNRGNVRFFTKEDFDIMSLVAMKLSHKLLLQLCWDIGENIMTILQLQKKDCQRIVDENTKEPEYMVVLPKDKIKRSRTVRSELTNYPETIELLDLHFNQGKRKFIPGPNGKHFRMIYDENKVRRKIRGEWKVFPFEEDDYLFGFGQKQAEQVFRRVVEITGVKCQPNGGRPTLKDLRSSMACHLLREGWSVDEVRGRMGHKPSSKVIDKYVTYLALNKHKPKQRMYESDLKRYQEELKESRNRERRNEAWIENQKREVSELKDLMQIYIAKLKQVENMRSSMGENTGLQTNTPVLPDEAMAIAA